jgi:hypothetical protein
MSSGCTSGIFKWNQRQMFILARENAYGDRKRHVRPDSLYIRYVGIVNQWKRVGIFPAANGSQMYKPDYFAEMDIEEMGHLIDFFAQRWGAASIMSDSRHKEIKAWKTAYK